MNQRKNWNCQNDKCTDPNSEVRLLPAGADSNMILCQACFNHEIAYRRDRNKELGSDAQFKLPRWEDLKVYAAT